MSLMCLLLLVGQAGTDAPSAAVASAVAGKSAIGDLRELGDMRVVDLRVATPTQADDLEYESLAYKTDTWYGSTFYEGPQWTRVGRDWQHSGDNQASVRVFHCPRAGRVRITGRVHKLHLDGDGVWAAIRSGQTLWAAIIDGTDDVGREFDVTIDVHAGQRICFALGKRGTIFCDTTYWDPTVDYADGEAYRASEGFSETPGLWSYELERGGSQEEQAPAAIYAPGEAPWEASQSGDSKAGLVTVRRGQTEASVAVVRLTGLVPTATYRIFEADGDDEAVRSGEELMESGLTLAVPRGETRQVALERVHAGVSSAPPEAPRSVTAEAHEGSVALRWEPPRDATGYAIERDGDVIARVEGETAYVDRDAGDEPHRYAVRAERGFLLSGATVVATGSEEPWQQRPDLGLWGLVEEDWLLQDEVTGETSEYLAAAEEQASRAAALAERLGGLFGDLDLAPAIERLGSLREEIANADIAAPDARRLYLNARWLKRQIALANPLLDFAELLFVKRVPTEYSHLVMQYFGWRARPGGGIYAIERPGWSLATRDVLDARLADGSVFAPNLSYDGDRVVFSWSSCDEADPYFHLFEARVDGSGISQLSSGPYEDLMPAYLPDGDIIFSSTRRRGYARCFGGQFEDRWHVYTLHRMGADGSNIRTLSFHETNEWFPAVLNDGSVAYARWDYVDRHAVLHQNLWRTRPDGTAPVALWGNHTQSPHCSFEARPVPGSSKILCTASAHHSITAGSVVLIDPEAAVDGIDAVERVTPDVCFPEAEGIPRSYYATPWPLSEDDYLVSYSHTPLIMEPAPNEAAALGIYLLDRAGNLELLYRDPDIGCTSPMPLAARGRPPIIAPLADEPPTATGEYLLLDVYRGLAGVRRGEAKRLRVLQILPKATPVADDPPVGLAGQEPTRMSLGTVPIAEDGSAYFEAPAGKPLLFQVLDDRGLALHTMRSVTYLQPGERMSCVGCHEPRTTAPPGGVAPVAREPSTIAPDPDGSMPFSYPRLVQQVLDRHCVSCHGSQDPAAGMSLTGEQEGAFTRSYMALTGGSTNFYQAGTNPDNAATALVPRFGGWNPVHDTPVGGVYGARGSRLMQLLLDGHEGVELPQEDLYRLAVWLDANAIFYGTYDRKEQARQLAGEAVAVPELQ